MSKTNMFETATRTKMRFPSIRNELTVEQLWDVPLRSNDGFNLDAIAKTVNKTVKIANEESFVDQAKKTVAEERALLTLDVVKYVINTKLEEEKAEAQRRSDKIEIEKLLGALERKQNEAIDGMTEGQIKKKLGDLMARSGA